MVNTENRKEKQEVQQSPRNYQQIPLLCLKTKTNARQKQKQNKKAMKTTEKKGKNKHLAACARILDWSVKTGSVSGKKIAVRSHGAAPKLAAWIELPDTMKDWAVSSLNIFDFYRGIGHASTSTRFPLKERCIFTVLFSVQYIHLDWKTLRPEQSLHSLSLSICKRLLRCLRQWLVPGVLKGAAPSSYYCLWCDTLNLRWDWLNYYTVL